MVIVSFPRSGQNLLNSIFEILCKSHGVEYTYCEYYDCCHSIPCKTAKLVSKSHDFDLKLNVDDDSKYISLYRKDPIYNLEAYYRFSLLHSGADYNYSDLISFITSGYGYYKKFVDKWITNTNHNILKIEYYDLVNNPIEMSKKCFSHFFSDVAIKEYIFDELVNKEINVIGCGISSKIKPLHELSEDLYNRIKSDTSHLFNN